jgi:hypothetical protein
MNNNLHKELYGELRQLIQEYKSYVNKSEHIRYWLKDIDHYERPIILNLKRELRNIKFEIYYLNLEIKELKNKIKLCQRSFDKSKSI